jgi:glycerophosphoryl diester phosphodiesterase
MRRQPWIRDAAICAALAAASITLSFPVVAAPVVIGHRGNSAMAPENTLAAMRAADGVCWGLECDPRVTSDGQVILMHDATVDRTTDGTDAVSGMTFAQIRFLDAGSWFSSAFAGEQVPTMFETIDVAISQDQIACLDIKVGSAALYASLLQPYQSQVEVHSFDWDFLSQVEAIDPGFTLVALGSGNLATSLASMPSCVDKISWLADSNLTASGIAAAHAAGKQVYAWTVDDVSTMLTLRDWEIDGIITNNPILATAVLNAEPREVGKGLPRRLRDGLMMNWTFDDGLSNPTADRAVDSVRGLDAVLAPEVELPNRWQGPGSARLGGALELDGQDDYAVVAPSPDTSPVTNAVSVSTWVKLDRLPSASEGLFQGILDSAEDAYVVYLDKGAKELRFKVTAGADALPGIPESALDTTAWHHVVGVYDGGAGVARIYLDGNLVDMHADDGPGAAGLQGLVGTQTIYFGRNGTDVNGFFDGKIDETAVWSRALSETEVRYLHNGGVGRPVWATNPFVAPATPVVRLEFEGNFDNQGSGDEAYNATLVTGPAGAASFTEGVHGQALTLDNPDAGTGGDYASIPYHLPDAGTIAFWCKPSDYYQYQTIFDNSTNPDDWEMWIYSDGRARFRIQDTAYTTFDLDALEGPNHWYHMALTWFRTGSNVVLNMYVDGLLRDVAEGPWVDPGETFFLAGGNPGNDLGRLSLDDFRIYDTVLTTDEIAAMFLDKETTDMIPGDANDDGQVDDQDASILASHWLTAGEATWWDGDFNGDGAVNDADAAVLAAHWHQGGEASGSGPAASEPGTAALLAAGSLAVASVRRWGR